MPAGKGIAALQEAGVIHVTGIHVPRIDVLGLYPGMQTLAAQLLVLLIVLASIGIDRLSARNKASFQQSARH